MHDRAGSNTIIECADICANCYTTTTSKPRTPYIPPPTMSSAARYRKPGTSSPPTNPVGEQEKADLKAAVKQQAAKTLSGVSVLDVLRIIGGVLLLSSGISYLTTSGESMTWGYNPWWTRAREWKTILVRSLCTTHLHHLTV